MRHQTKNIKYKEYKFYLTMFNECAFRIRPLQVVRNYASYNLIVVLNVASNCIFANEDYKRINAVK